MAQTNAKHCGACGANVSNQERVRDTSGNYFCHPCWALAGEPTDPVPTRDKVCAACGAQYPDYGVTDEGGLAICVNCHAGRQALTPETRRMLCSGVAITLLIMAAIGTYFFYSGRWERTHRDQLLALKSDAEAHARKGKPKLALERYDQLFKEVGDHSVESPSLREELNTARIARQALAPKVEKLIAHEALIARRQDELAEAAGLNSRGMNFEEGDTVKQDFKQAISFYQKAAQLNFAPAMTNMGRMYDPAENTLFENAPIALTWYRKAAELGDTQAMFLLGKALFTGDGISLDEREAEVWLAKAAGPIGTAAGAGDSRAMLSLGVLRIVGGGGLTKDFGSGLKLVRSSAEAGNTWAMLLLARLYYEGVEVEKSVSEALEWGRRGAKAHNAHAMVYTAYMLSYQKDKVGWQEAERWDARAAELGLPLGLSRMGMNYRMGLGIPQSTRLAFECFRKASEAGSTDAMIGLSAMYDMGEGVPRDSKQAAEWLQKGAEAGSAYCMRVLAGRYRTGEGVLKDGSAAVTWLQQAAQIKDVKSVAILADIYFKGDVVQQDFVAARQCALDAANRGDTGAMLILQKIYREGRGVAKNQDESSRWERLYWHSLGKSEGEIENLVTSGSGSTAREVAPRALASSRPSDPSNDALLHPEVILSAATKVELITFFGMRLGDPPKQIPPERVLKISRATDSVPALLEMGKVTQEQLENLDDGYVFTRDAIGYAIKGGQVVAIRVMNKSIIEKLGIKTESDASRIFGRADKIDRDETTVFLGQDEKISLNTYHFGKGRLTVTYKGGYWSDLWVGR